MPAAVCLSFESVPMGLRTLRSQEEKVPPRRSRFVCRRRTAGASGSRWAGHGLRPSPFHSRPPRPSRDASGCGKPAFGIGWLLPLQAVTGRRGCMTALCSQSRPTFSRPDSRFGTVSSASNAPCAVSLRAGGRRRSTSRAAKWPRRSGERMPEASRRRQRPPRLPPSPARPRLALRPAAPSPPGLRWWGR